MYSKTDCVAIHEAGHALAHIITGSHFDYVTIKEDNGINKPGQRVLGLTKLDKPQTNKDWDQFSILNPNEFDRFFKDNFISISGYVAETIYRGRSNTKSSKEDLRQWLYISLKHLSEQLSSKYISFLLAYAFEVLHKDENWSNIAAIALALVDEDTLSYDRVCEVIEQNKQNPIL